MKKIRVINRFLSAKLPSGETVKRGDVVEVSDEVAEEALKVGFVCSTGKPTPTVLKATEKNKGGRPKKVSVSEKKPASVDVNPKGASNEGASNEGASNEGASNEGASNEVKPKE